MPTAIGAEIISNDEKDVARALLAEITAIRTAYALLVAKLDADAGVTDTNYAATCSPAAAAVTN